MTQKKRIRLKVASPCDVDWDSMKGNDSVRHCGLCKKNVYQLSNMSTEEVERLLGSKPGETCVRFYQRADGTLLVDDCKVGVKRRRRKQAIVGVGAGLLSAFGLAVAAPSAPATATDARPVAGIEHTISMEEAVAQMEELANELLNRLRPTEPDPDYLVMGMMGEPEYVPEPHEAPLELIESPEGE